MSCFMEIQWFCWYVSLFDVLVTTIHLWQRSIYITVHKYSILTCNRMSNEDSNRTTYYKVWFGEFIITRHHYTNTNERDTKTTETNSCPNHFIISNILKLVDHWNKQTYKHHNVFQKRSMEKRNIRKSIMGPKNTWLSGFLEKDVWMYRSSLVLAHCMPSMILNEWTTGNIGFSMIHLLI